MERARAVECELAVIGAGMAGMAGALFAANRGMSVVQVGGTGGIAFSSGLLDLLGVHPVEEGRCWDDPWAALERLRTDIPGHPLALVGAEDIRAALEEFLTFLEQAGLGYVHFSGRNAQVVTLLGTVKPTYAVPVTMCNGVDGYQERQPCLFLDFYGLKEYNANLIVSSMAPRWHGIRSVRLSFPGSSGVRRLYTGHMAWQMETEEFQERLAQLIRAEVRGGEYVALPAILGMHKSRDILDRIARMIGARVFEVSTLPASVPGLRLKDAFETNLSSRGVQARWESRVTEVRRVGRGTFVLRLEDGANPREIHAGAVLLATGRFFGKGLVADRMRVREAVLDLPVWQPGARSQWHHRDLMDPRGHPINQAGIETDDSFRPLVSAGTPAYPNLFAAGSILAHNDWSRMKSGAGVAIATSYAAVKSLYKTRS